MSKWQLQTKDKRGKIHNRGMLEIENKAGSVDLYMTGDITSDTWDKWSDEDTCPSDLLNFFNQIDSSVDTINVHINSGGGSVFGGIAIANLLDAHPARVVTHITALAASIAGYIAMRGDEVVAYEDSMFMMHKPSSICCGTADDFRKNAEVLDKCQELLISCFTEKARDGITDEKINQMINDETWLTGKELSDYFDVKVVKSNQAVAWADSSYMDLYQKAPEAPETKAIVDSNEELKKELIKDLYLFG